MSQESSDSDYIPSQSTPESEDYTSYESSSLDTPSENSSEYSIATSSQCSGSSDYNSSYFDSSQSSTSTESDEYIEQIKEDGSRSDFIDIKY